MIIRQRTGFFVLKPKIMNLDFFKGKAKVVDGLFASDIVEKIYNSLFINSIDIESDYFEYFSEEFETFDEFLIKRYYIDDDILKIIREKLITHNILFQSKYSDRYDIFIEMLFSDGLFEVIDNLTEM